MALYNFADLITKYSVDCTLVTFSEGKYSGGEYVPGEETDTPISAAVITMSVSKIYQSGGAYTANDREMYILKENDIIDLEKQKRTYLVHNGRKFKVEQGNLYGEDYADFNHYYLRRVDSFDRENNT